MRRWGETLSHCCGKRAEADLRPERAGVLAEAASRGGLRSRSNLPSARRAIVQMCAGHDDDKFWLGRRARPQLKNSIGAKQRQLASATRQTTTSRMQVTSWLRFLPLYGEDLAETCGAGDGFATQR